MRLTFFTLQSALLHVTLAGILVMSACQKEVTKPPRQTISIPAVSGTVGGGFEIESDNIVETTNGFNFTGLIRAKTDEGMPFTIGEGEFQVETNSDSSISSIKGVGIAQFPDIGIFKHIKTSFLWTEIKSHIEYEKGSYYLQTYGTDLPLAAEQQYLHFRVFDQSKDGEYQLRSVANSIIYNFLDLYIDPNDPAVFFKTQLWKPGSNKKEVTNLVSTFWKKVGDKLVSAGGTAFDYADATGMAIGISNQGTFLSQPYDFKVSDSETFKSKFGFNRFEALPSHLFFKLAGIPIPETGVLQMTGEAFIHYPFSTLIPPASVSPVKENYQDALDWFMNDEQNGYMVSFTGSIDPGAKGIGLALGMLPNVNKIVGKEIFNEDFDIDIIGATSQWQIPGLNQAGSGQVPSFFRYGGETKIPVVSEIFGEGIKKYLYNPPTAGAFFYYSLGPEIENIVVYSECEAHMRVPYYGIIDFGRSSFAISIDGIDFVGKRVNAIGPLHLGAELTGKLSPEGFNLKSIVDNTITLPSGVELFANKMDLTISSDSGITYNGSVDLPFDIGEAEAKGKLTSEGVSLSGKLKAGSEIVLPNGVRLPSAGMTFSASSNPAEAVQLEGNLDIPYIGMVAVKGKINKDDFLLEGKVNTADITFGNIKLPSANGIVRISKKTGIYFKSEFDLGIVFGRSRLMEGYVNAAGITMTGQLSNSIRIAGANFTFANGKITAGPAGVKIGGNIDLNIFKANVAGELYGVNNFLLKGAYNYNTRFFKSSIGVAVTPQKVNLSGNGTVYGAFGNELYNGGMTFEPNWSARTVSACYILGGTKACITL